jgi:hypothetical protein
LIDNRYYVFLDLFPVSWGEWIKGLHYINLRSI